MTCPKCQERRKAVRDAWIAGRIAEAVREAAKGAVEVVTHANK